MGVEASMSVMNNLAVYTIISYFLFPTQTSATANDVSSMHTKSSRPEARGLMHMLAAH